MSSFKNPFGLINGKLTHVKDIEKNDEVYCPECGDRLIVREGSTTRKHLAHKVNTNNKCSNESIIHKYTKLYLCNELKKMKVFNDKIIAVNGKFKLSDAKYLKIKSIDSEYRELSKIYIPDLFLKLEDNSEVAIEICYKNPKNKEHLQEILPSLKIDQVYEIKVTEDDLSNFNIEKIVDRAELIYNKIGKEFEKAKSKMMSIYYKNQSLENYTKCLIDEIRSLRSKVDGRYMKRVQKNFMIEKIRLESEIKKLKTPHISLDECITSWKAKVFNYKQRIPSGDINSMENDLICIRRYYYNLEQELHKIKDESDALKEILEPKHELWDEI